MITGDVSILNVEIKVRVRANLQKNLHEIKGPCAALVLCGRAVLYEHVNKPYMNCKQRENILKIMAANYYEFPVQ